MVVVAERFEDRARQLADRYGILATSLRDAVEGADVIVVAVKPADVRGVLEQVADIISYTEKDPVVVSLAAGISIPVCESVLAAGTPVIRVMPNTPMLVRAGVSAIAGGRYARPEDIEVVRDIFRHVGTAVVVSEAQMDAVTAVSGSGPAYFFLVVEAMIDAGVQLGLTAELATELAVGTLRGAGEMLAAEGADDPRAQRLAVSSPAGTTAAAVRALESGGIRGAFYEAMGACRDRSRQIGIELAPTVDD